MRCWYTRWQMSNALDRGDSITGRGTDRGTGHGTGRGNRGHLARCASCQAFGRALESLHAGLSRGADAAPVPVVAPRPRRPWLVAGPVAVTAAAVIVIAIGVNGGPAPVVAPPVDPQGSEALVRMQRVAERVAQAFTNTPLDTELDDLIRDSKRGLDAVLATGGLQR